MICFQQYTFHRSGVVFIISELKSSTWLKLDKRKFISRCQPAFLLFMHKWIELVFLAISCQQTKTPVPLPVCPIWTSLLEPQNCSLTTNSTECSMVFSFFDCSTPTMQKFQAFGYPKNIGSTLYCFAGHGCALLSTY